MIEIRNLTKRFGDAVVLDSLDLDIRTGECLVILGRSGCGKSVLLKHIIGLIRPDAGTVRVDGVEVGGLSYDGLADLRRRFGMLFQMAALFDSMTVGENVGLALREHTKKSEAEVRAICEEKLTLVGLPDIQEKKPADLSGGMRKRVGLARALAMSPDYLLFDEPTTGLDPITAEQINLRIRGLQERLEVTSVAVTHDMRSAYAIGDRLCLLHEGKIRFVGTPDEVRETTDPLMRQFIHGDATGPMTDATETAGRGRKV
jgi:phospholipid/cholesterol/gamma-HCH transport system ATP-binding protein